MKPNRKNLLIAFTAVSLVIQAALPSPVLAGSSRSLAAQWNVQVDKVEPGEVNIEPAFRVAIYENLLDELAKTKQFKQVLRSGDRCRQPSRPARSENNSGGIHSGQRDPAGRYNGERSDEVEGPKSALHAGRADRLGTCAQRQCPFFRRQLASHP